MAVTRRDPMRDIISLRERMNRMFEDALAATRDTEVEPPPGSWSPAVDICEEDGRIVLRADLPGVGPDQLRIRVANNTLTISGERRSDSGPLPDGVHRAERRFGNFSRSFNLPGSVDVDGIRAEHRDGVLEVSLPRRDDARSRQIDIQVR
jgi:HSP20 family protein